MLLIRDREGEVDQINFSDFTLELNETKKHFLLPAFKRTTVNQQNINLLSIHQGMIFFPCEIKDKSCSESLSS